MEQMIIFFDGECALCNTAVRFLVKKDKKEKFLFAPLQGETAEEMLEKPISLDSLILWDGEKELRFGKGALRICWHLGGLWKLLGALSFLPTFLADWIYRLIARNRHLFPGAQEVELPRSRLLQ